METGYFGLCPHCHKVDGHINVLDMKRGGYVNCFYCVEHRAKWWDGVNLFSIEETNAELKEHYDSLGFADFEVVSPFYPEAMLAYMRGEP